MNKLLASLCVLLGMLFVPFGLRAQAIIALYTDTIPNARPCADQETWTTSKNGRVLVHHVTVPTLTVFEPASLSADAPAAIICPGGGYGNLSIGDGGIETAQLLAEQGIVAFVLKYRLPDSVCHVNPSIVPLQDVQQALYRVRKEADKWHVNVDSVGLVGFSAGGHLAATAATHYDTPLIDAEGLLLRPAFTVLVYPVISFTDRLTSPRSQTRKRLIGANPSAAQVQWFSPELNANAQTPPAMLLHAEDDSTAWVANSEAYARVLREHHVQVTFHRYPTGGHGFANYNRAEGDTWIPRAVAWIRNLSVGR